MATVIASERCRACIMNLRTIASRLASSGSTKGPAYNAQVNDQLEKFALWMGNIGCLHKPESPLSLESRLREASDVLTHVLELLDDLKDVTILEIVSGERKGQMASKFTNSGTQETQFEETELCKEIDACITRLFRASYLIRQAAPTDVFAKSLSQNRYYFNDQFDIAHVGEAYPKLASNEFSWLKEKLGRAITHRRHYLSYIKEHREKQEVALKEELTNSSSRTSPFITMAPGISGHITSNTLTALEESDTENVTSSSSNISRSINDEFDSWATNRVPKLASLQSGSKKEVECPFCYRIKEFKSEQAWRHHVFSDLRAYVCTFPECDAGYFSEINQWFRHEMQCHRVSYLCHLCAKETFRSEKSYLAHMLVRHPDMLKDSDEKLVLDIARKPLHQIPVQDCPCCIDWSGRRKEKAVVINMGSSTSDNELCVTPEIFKYHLASHLEHLTSFAIPISSNTDDGGNIKGLVQSEMASHPKGLSRPSPVFDYPRSSTSVGKSQSFGQDQAYKVATEYMTGDHAAALENFKATYLNQSQYGISGGVVMLAAENEKFGTTIMNYLLDKKGHEVQITEAVLRSAAGNEHSGREVVELLLNRKGYEFRITASVLKVAARNPSSGRDIIELLLDRRGDEFQITEGVLISAAMNEKSGRDIMKLLLGRRGDEIQTTQTLVYAAVRNQNSGRGVMELLLDEKGDEVQITERVVIETMANEKSGRDIMELLLDRRGDAVPITEMVVKEAKRKRTSGKDLMELLLDRRLDSIADIAKEFQNQGRWNDAEGLEMQVMRKRKEKLGYVQS